VVPPRAPGESDITDFRGTRIADFPTLTGPETTVGQAGIIAAATVEALMKHIAATVAEETIGNYAGGKLIHLIGFLGKKGWKIVRGSKGEIIDILTAEGKSATRKDWESAIRGFEKEPCPSSSKGTVPSNVLDEMAGRGGPGRKPYTREQIEAMNRGLAKLPGPKGSIKLDPEFIAEYNRRTGRNARALFDPNGHNILRKGRNVQRTDSRVLSLPTLERCRPDSV
jgi:hypothetical protein